MHRCGLSKAGALRIALPRMGGCLTTVAPTRPTDEDLIKQGPPEPETYPVEVRMQRLKD